MLRTYLRTRDVAAILGCTTQYVWSEIRVSGRLQAAVVPRSAAPGRARAQAAIRVYPEQLTAYVEAYWPEKREAWLVVQQRFYRKAS